VPPARLIVIDGPGAGREIGLSDGQRWEVMGTSRLATARVSRGESGHGLGALGYADRRASQPPACLATNGNGR
jgi:hypothetical protein